MTERREGQIPFGDLVGMNLVTNLDTGEQKLRRRRTGRAAGATKAPVPTRQWWDIVGLMSFNKAAEGWKVGQTALIEEAIGQNMEFGSAQATSDEAEAQLKKAFAIAKRSRITTLDIVGMMRAESLNLEVKLGAGGHWIPAFVDSAINSLAEVYKLNSSSTEALKRVAHQRRLPQFS